MARDDRREARSEERGAAAETQERDRHGGDAPRTSADDDRRWDATAEPGWGYRPERGRFGTQEREAWSDETSSPFDDRSGSYGIAASPGHGGGPVLPAEDNFAGFGPIGYRRADDRICEEANQRLTEHPRVDARHVEVRVASGEVTLEGHVPDREQKRAAEDVAKCVYGVRDVHNRLRVDRPGHSFWG